MIMAARIELDFIRAGKPLACANQILVSYE